MKPKHLFFLTLVCLAIISCGKKYTCDCTNIRYDYNNTGTDSTLTTTNFTSTSYALTYHKAEQNCFSTYARERTTTNTGLGVMVANSTTCSIR